MADDKPWYKDWFLWVMVITTVVANVWTWLL